MALASRKDRGSRHEKRRGLIAAAWVEPLEDRRLLSGASDFTILAVSQPTVVVGTNVTFTATVVPAASGIRQKPTGTMTFLLGGATTLGTVNVSSGRTVFHTTSSDPLPVGADDITAVYSGDANYATSTSSAGSVVVEDRLAIVQQPKTSIAGSDISPSVTVVLKDQHGQVITTDSSSVITIAVEAGPAGGTLSGTVTATASDGTATFSNISLGRSGTYALVAAGTASVSVRSSDFIVKPDATDALLVVTQQPDPTVPVPTGFNLAPAVVIDIEDPFGNIVNSDQGRVTITGGDVSGSGTSVNAVNGVARFTSLSIPTAGAGTDTFVASYAVTGVTTATFQQIAEQTTVAMPKVAAYYVQGTNFNITSALKSKVSSSYAGTATLVDQHSDVLGAVTVSGGGGITFNLSNVAAGTYTCTIDYSGDSFGHAAATSATFTLNVKAPVVSLTNQITRLGPRTATFGTAISLETEIFNTGSVTADGSLEIDVSLELDGVVKQVKTQFITVDIAPNHYIFATVGMTIASSNTDPAGIYQAVVTVDGNVNFSNTATTPTTDEDVETARPIAGDSISGSLTGQGQTSISEPFITID